MLVNDNTVLFDDQAKSAAKYALALQKTFDLSDVEKQQVFFALNSKTTSFARIAMPWAELGYTVVPSAKNSKAPAVAFARYSYHAKGSTDPLSAKDKVLLAAAWATKPRDNWDTERGLLLLDSNPDPRLHLVAIDVDDPSQWNWVFENYGDSGLLNESGRKVPEGSRKPGHLLFRAEGKVTGRNGLIGEVQWPEWAPDATEPPAGWGTSKVDVKAAANYIVAPGSMHASGEEYKLSKPLSLEVLRGLPAFNNFLYEAFCARTKAERNRLKVGRIQSSEVTDEAKEAVGLNLAGHLLPSTKVTTHYGVESSFSDIAMNLLPGAQTVPVFCPVHENHETPAASIGKDKTGSAFLRCFGSCDTTYRMASLPTFSLNPNFSEDPVNNDVDDEDADNGAETGSLLFKMVKQAQADRAKEETQTLSAMTTPFDPAENPFLTLSYIEGLDTVWDAKSKRMIPWRAIAKRGGLFAQWADKMSDGKRKTYIGLTFDPNPNAEEGEDLNTFDIEALVRPKNEVQAPQNDAEWAEWCENGGSDEDIQMLHRLIYNLCEGQHIEMKYLSQWLGRKIRTPWYNKQTVTVLRGAEGTGKGLLSTVLNKIFGQYYAMATQDALESRFNGGLIFEKLFVVGNEIASTFFRDKKAAANKMKGMMVGDDITVEFKGREAFTVPNYTTWLLCSNDRTPVYVTEGDRRYSVIESNSPLLYMPSDERSRAFAMPAEDYIKALAKLIENEAWIQKVTDWFSCLTLEGFTPIAPLVNAAKEEMIQDNKGDVELWWDDFLPPAGEYPTALLHKHYAFYCRKNGSHPVDVRAFGRLRPTWVKMGGRKRKSSFEGQPCYDWVDGKDGHRFLTIPNRGQDMTMEEWASFANIPKDKGVI